MANGMGSVCLALVLCAGLASAQSPTGTDALATLQQQAASIPGQVSGFAGQVGEQVASAAGTTRDTLTSAVGGAVGTATDPVANALGQLGMSPDTTTGSVDTSSLGADATPGSYGVDTEPSPSPRPTPTRMPAPTTAVISQTPSAVASPPPKSSGSTAAVSVAAVVVGGLAVLAL